MNSLNTRHKKHLWKVIFLFPLIILFGCAPILLQIKPNEISQEKLNFKILGVQEDKHLVRVTIAIENKTTEPQPFTPSQAYLVTSDRRVIYSGIPQKKGYETLPPVTTTKQTGTITNEFGMTVARTEKTSTTGSSLAEQIVTLVENSKTKVWNERMEETILPSYIPPRTILQGHLWFRWTKMQAIEKRKDNFSYYYLPIPLTLHILTSEGNMKFSLTPERNKEIKY